jgi:hypothetical protein
MRRYERTGTAMKVTAEDMEAIHDDRAKFLGSGEWDSGGCYHGYQIEDRFIVVIVTDPQSLWIEDDTAEYVMPDKLEDYIDVEN